MDESVVKNFEQQTQPTIKMSEAIRLGHEKVNDYRPAFLQPVNYDYLESGLMGCALGTAWVGAGKNYDDWHKESVSNVTSGQDAFDILRNHFPVPREILKKVSCFHYYGEKSRLEIADWLEDQGY